MKVNVWQAKAIADAMHSHDNPGADLESAYADVETRTVEDDYNARIIVIRWEDGARLVLGDQYANQFSDETGRYPEDAS